MLHLMENGRWWNMKKLKIKLVGIVFNKKGEMLIETIISIMLFVVLISGVTMIISSATSGIRSTQREAEDVQNTVNMMMSEPDTSASDTTVTVVLDISTVTTPSTTEKTVIHSAKLVSQSDLIYFYTEPSTP